MILCYIDESGTSNIPGNTSHFILSGISIPVEKWKYCDTTIAKLKTEYNLTGTEIHTAWMLRPFIEQRKIPKFEEMNYQARRNASLTYRKKELFRLQKSNPKLYKQVKKNQRNTDAYCHLSFKERKNILIKLSQMISKWEFARLFAECIDKTYFNPELAKVSVEEQAFEQIVSRFEQYLQITSTTEKNIGMLIHDNNPTVSKKLTDLMIKFYKQGTLWTKVTNIIETPLFVDSQLTSMVQIADLCSYALRRFLENNETFIFNNIFKRADKKDSKVVGVRHYSTNDCECKICKSH